MDVKSAFTIVPHARIDCRAASGGFLSIKPRRDWQVGEPGGANFKGPAGTGPWQSRREGSAGSGWAGHCTGRCWKGRCGGKGCESQGRGRGADGRHEVIISHIVWTRRTESGLNPKPRVVRASDRQDVNTHSFKDVCGWCLLALVHFHDKGLFH
jgi:hypothetical protein